MSRLRQRAERGLLIQRVGGTAVCAAAGAAGLACLAWAEGLPPAGPAAAGAVLAGLMAALRYPWSAPPAGELDPEADADGLLRAALTVPAGHPFADRLAAQAAGRRLRFRRLEDGRPLLVWAAACLLLAVWMQAEPAFRPGETHVATASAGAAPGTAAAVGRTGPAEPESADHDPAAEPERPPAAATEAAEWWTVPLATAPSAAAVIAGRGHGSARGVVDRYLRLRDEEGS